MIIHVYNQQKDLPLAHKKKKIHLLIQGILWQESCIHTEVSLYFVSQKKISSLHEQFFADPTPTDCISFPLDDIASDVLGKNYLGDIFVCPLTAIQFAKKKNLDPYKEVTLYIIHGVLHLLGYDDLEPNKKRQMRRKEKLYIQQLEKQDLLLTAR